MDNNRSSTAEVADGAPKKKSPVKGGTSKVGVGGRKKKSDCPSVVNKNENSQKESPSDLSPPLLLPIDDVVVTHSNNTDDPSVVYGFDQSDACCGGSQHTENFIMRLSFPQLVQTDNPDPYNKEESFVFDKNRSCTFSSIVHRDSAPSFPVGCETNELVMSSSPLTDTSCDNKVSVDTTPPTRPTPIATRGGSCQYEGRHRNIVKLLMDFEKKSTIEEWPLNTNVHCYWCCHQFDGAPLGLPVTMNLEETKYCVVGCFCSLECACAYNFASKENTDECLNRYSLLNGLAIRLGLTTRVSPAPDRLALKMFGGNLGIDEFRSFSASDRFVIVNTPPMISLTQQVEEIHEHDTHSGYRYVPLDNERVTKFQEKIRLKRSKPLVNTKNTLDHSMKLTYNSSA